MNKVTVLVIDDSALIRQLLSELLNADPDIEVIATARDAFDAREKIKKFNPDVLTLDVEMPKMDGVTFLKNLMRLHPLPVVMISTMTEQGAKVTIEALEEGAIDFVAKPKINVLKTLESYADEIVNKVKIAAKANVNALEFLQQNTYKIQELSVDRVVRKQVTNAAILESNNGGKIVGIGASTGGTKAIGEILSHLSLSCPAIVIAQHIPVTFSDAFAARLNKKCEIEVCVAEDGQQILAGHAYIAPGDKHLTVETKDGLYFCKLNDAPAVNLHKPSVDVLFGSLAKNVGANAIGLMLTGMGADGAKGMLEMKTAGAFNFVQDKSSSVVWGMPSQAVKIGAAELQLPLKDIAAKLMERA